MPYSGYFLLFFGVGSSINLSDFSERFHFRS